MAVRYGLPFFLEDKTGRLSGSEFLEIHDRMKLLYRRRVHDDTGTIYDIYDITTGSSESFQVPVVSLSFGADNSLGTIKYRSQQPKQISRYLSEVSIFAGSRLRRFFGSDGNEYRWGYRLAEGNEWTCTNSRAEIVAHYNLKHPGEPPYYSSSGCMLTVLEDFGHLACEMLATVMIMRHIVAHDL
ncbi:hypothetical protein BDZ97DRAFT_1673450 [Flammula alnicola]|nr:hypothetical protein BDZ97DRAFT_1673450 [Flammula alnicola]